MSVSERGKKVFARVRKTRLEGRKSMCKRERKKRKREIKKDREIKKERERKTER